MISDHALVLFSTRLKKPRSDTPLITSRAWHRLSHDAFASDLSASRLCGDITELAGMSANDLVDLYRRVFTDLLDKHCPVVQVRRRTTSTAPWFNADCHAARWSARVAECRYSRTHFDVNRSNWLTRLKTIHLVYEKRNDEFRAERDHIE